MGHVPKVFKQFIPQLLHVVVLPIFFFVFILVYRPFEVHSLLGHEWFGVHLTIVTCIVLLSAILMRLVYYFLPVNLNYPLYILWCIGEIAFMSFFAALYLYLVLGKPLPYFEVMTVAFKCMFFTLILPYVGLGMALRIYDYHESAAHPEDHSIQRMRFYDSMRNLKIVLMPQSVLYIAAEENYVIIYYTENERVKEYVLRSSMKAIDEVCQDNGLIRCHRSYYINPAHVKVLRKDKDGVMYAELNADNLRNIPVSKTYYSRLSEML